MAELYEQDDDLGFWENMGQEETPETPVPDAPTAEVETAPEVVAEVPAEPADTAAAEAETTEPQQDRPRDDKGRFVKLAETEDPDLQAYLGKYGGDPEKALRAAVDAQRVIGQQGQELGELRRMMEERLEQIQTQTRPQPQQAPAVEQIQEHLYENPHAIIPTIQQAHQAALAGDPAAAIVRDTALATLRELNGVEAERQSRWVATTEWQTQQQREAQQQSQYQSQTQATWNQIAGDYAAKNPQAAQLTPQIEEVALEFPAIVDLLASPDPNVKIQALDFLVTKASARASDTLNTASQEILRDAAADAARAAQDATVVSTTTAKPPPAPLSAADRIGAEWDAIEAPLASGWNIGNGPR